jgi:dimethylhistidine N-methyltransferase
MRRSVALAVDGRLAADREFLGDVTGGLTSTPKTLDPRWLYDDLGSSLFEAICRLPWYRVTRAEMGLLARHAPAIAEALGPAPAIIELGPGSGEKLACIVAAVVERGGRPDVHLVDVSAQALQMARQTLGPLAGAEPVLHEHSYEKGLERAVRATRRGRRMVAFLGSNLGNFNPPDAVALLRSIARVLSPRDQLLLGLDLVKPEPELLLAYADPLGVTAAFNLNLLLRINRELGGTFEVRRFEHQARWNGAASRVEMHLASTVRQNVRIAAAGLEIGFERGETIWTESSYKFEAGDVPSMGERAGFAVLRQWVDRDAGFALTLFERAD